MPENRRMPFSERIGAVRRTLQKDSMDDALKNSLWNIAYSRFWIDLTGYRTQARSAESGLLAALWRYHFNLVLSDLDDYCAKAVSQLKTQYMKSNWASAYDFIDYIADSALPNQQRPFIAECNAALIKHVSAYRFVGATLTPITSDEEIASVEQAMSHGERFRPVITHIETALACLANRASPDYRNSIKESVSAVEAVCQIITGDSNATLGKALKVLDVHSALAKGFGAIYGYTSEDQGIRHALLEAPTVGVDDAKFFLVACSAFVNYLIAKSATGTAIAK